MDLLERVKKLNTISLRGLTEEALRDHVDTLETVLSKAQQRSLDSQRLHTQLRHKQRTMRLEAMSLHSAALKAQKKQDIATVREHVLKKRDLNAKMAYFTDEIQRERTYLQSFDLESKRLREQLRDARSKLPGTVTQHLAKLAKARSPEGSTSQTSSSFTLPWERTRNRAEGEPSTLEDCLFSPLALGDLIYDMLRERVGISRGSDAQHVQEISNRVLKGRPEWRHLETLVLNLKVPTAFTCPGRYIYICEPLLDKLTSDDALAFIIGHETAHHDLGHLAGFHNRLSKLPRFAGVGVAAGILVALYCSMERKLHSPENECDADRHGLGLALIAGFDGERAVETFDVLEGAIGELGLDEDMVFGPQFADYARERDAISMTDRARVWAWERGQGYLPIRERKRRLVVYLEEREKEIPSMPPPPQL